MKRFYKDDGIIYTFNSPITGLIDNTSTLIYILDVFVPFDTLKPRVMICFNPKNGCLFRGNPEQITIKEKEILR